MLACNVCVHMFNSQVALPSVLLENHLFSTESAHKQSPEAPDNLISINNTPTAIGPVVKLRANVEALNTIAAMAATRRSQTDLEVDFKQQPLPAEQTYIFSVPPKEIDTDLLALSKKSVLVSFFKNSCHRLLESDS